ncbi:SusD/RagB family nutrient-binding outer membrane lipoprotein [Solitalea lacus]|uniref:SusD/RagB family nutrient-binding outer membrane lipoprotein n=1 Tax=Solitalea lacus TaxID=2911172 RepID=UPI001EDBFDB1|nr:SusD/RagB family nutrient-binding outer membrane lipoprotein [Solitalea lacus]UKJ07696.1 SusD/RagB family nutrient-binding outer membrane lipoprotein [Solitalea lacus]
MKNIYKKILVLMTLSLVFSVSCTEDFESINTDPTGASGSDIDPNILLSNVELVYTGSTDFSYETWRANLIYCSTMMQQLSSVNSYWVGDKSRRNDGYLFAYWERAFNEQVKIVVDLMTLTKDKPQYSNLYNTARIMRALIFHRITDLYGDVPYTEAGLGYYNQILTPKYDKQQDIYADMLNELDEASQALDPSKDVLKNDLIYNGSIANWKRFANSIQLRLAMRLVKVDPAKAKDYAARAIGRGVFDSETQDAKVFGSEEQDRLTKNRNAQVILQGYERSADRISATFVNWFKSKNDPRLAYYAEDPATAAPATNASIGMPNGYDLGGVKSIETAPGYPGSLNGYVQPATKTIEFKSPTFFMTAAEAQLLASEAVLRGYVAGDANAYFKKGVALAIKSFIHYGIAVNIANADAYGNSLALTGGNELRDINEQLWAACGGTYNFYESYSNWRRTGFPVLIPTDYPTSVIGAAIPRRFTYPTGEASVNAANYQAAVAALPGGDALTSRVWWDK